ncbi:hypothetical protein TSUD_117430 [Trifolium subterraneum]|nr:hypothetical protein TSUD_117430 [Trifolium subterraneum]
MSKHNSSCRFPYFLPSIFISAFAFVVAIACIWLPVFALWAVSPRRLGGLNFTTDNVGDVLAISGLALIVFQLSLYPSLERVFGPVRFARISGVRFLH